MWNHIYKVRFDYQSYIDVKYSGKESESIHEELIEDEKEEL